MSTRQSVMHLEEESLPYDVIIIGGSFAGLATAMQLRDHRVLVVDQYPIGAHQSSTCGIPLAIVQAVHAEAAVLETHHHIVMHTSGRVIRFAMPEPYVTVDYEAFCRAMLAQSDAEVWLARASAHRDGEVVTSAGSAAGRYVVDASGWRSLHGQSVSPPGPMSFAGRGIETELPARVDAGDGLHFFFDRSRVRSGYAWIFPCGEMTRVGVYSTVEHAHLRERLETFVGELGFVTGPTHGGVMPMVRRAPIAHGVFLVGDAAGQCLPVTAEGIRAAILHGIGCGRLISAALDGVISRAEAERRFLAYVQQTSRFQRRLQFMQAVVDRAPERAMALLAQACSLPPLSRRTLRSYLRRSGWLPDLPPALDGVRRATDIA